MKSQGKENLLNKQTIADLLDYMTPDELIALIEESRASLLEQFTEFSESGEHERKIQIAHSIKGECGTIGASALHKIFMDLENKLRHGNNPGRNHPAYSFEELFADFHSAMITFIEHGK